MTLFTRVGRNLELTETGRLVLSYANEIFSLGDELREVIHQLPDGRPQLFRVGVVDVVSKSITHRILKPALQMPVRMICREASFIRCWRNWPCTVLSGAGRSSHPSLGQHAVFQSQAWRVRDQLLCH